jgi:hypothetical protein
VVEKMPVFGQPFHMTLRSDEQGRLGCAALFAPNSEFNVERLNDGSVRVEQVPPQKSRLVRPIVTKEGFLMVPIELDSKEIASAIRADQANQ